MATTVTAGSGGAYGTIKFEYTIETILEMVESETANISSKLESETEVLDKYTLTSDELFHFTKFLKDAHLNVSKIVQKMTQGIATPLFLDATKVSYTVVGKSDYNTATLPILDKVIFDAICFSIIRDWFVQCGLKDYVGLYDAKYKDSFKLAVKYSINLRRGAIN